MLQISMRLVIYKTGGQIIVNVKLLLWKEDSTEVAL
jgi:hypothetical protein